MFRIIVAEDEPDIRALYAKVLRQNGYEVLEANDGEEVLALLGSSNADLIISDVMMPKMDGYEMVAALRQMHTNIPILLITAKDSFLDLRKGFLTGADDYMTKPININEMVLRVQALLRRSQMNAEQSCVLVQPLWTTTPSASHPGQRSSSYRRRNSCCCSSCCPIQARRSLGSS